MNTFEQLERVDLRLRSPIPDYEPKVKAFLGAPRLHAAVLDVLSTLHFPMPYSQLTNLTIVEP